MSCQHSAPTLQLESATGKLTTNLRNKQQRRAPPSQQPVKALQSLALVFSLEATHQGLQSPGVAPSPALRRLLKPPGHLRGKCLHTSV
jgi:hypothetical protein